MSTGHPYRDFENQAVWKVLSRGIKAIEANGDLKEMIAQPYIVGYLAKLLIESGLVVDECGPNVAASAEAHSRPKAP